MTENNITIRPVTAQDLATVVALDAQFCDCARQDFFAKRLKAQQASPATFISLIAESQGEVAGFVSCHLQAGEFGDSSTSAVLDAIGVDRNHQRQGIGQALFGALIDAINTRGGKELQSVVKWNQPDLLRFFSDAGFQLAAKTVLELDTSALHSPSLESEDNNSDLSRDPVQIRSLRRDDTGRLSQIDRHITGSDRIAYYQRIVTQAIDESGVRVSLVADRGDPIGDGLATLAGYVMARVDYGEFGQTGPEAVIDTLGVDPASQGEGIGQALVGQLITNLKGLRVESVRTEVPWDNFSLSRFLLGCGFRPAQRLSLTRPITD